RSQIQDASLAALLRLLEAPRVNNEALPARFLLKTAEPCHSDEMANVYRQVFKTYPFPIQDASYLKKTMNEGKVIYFGIWNNGKLAGLSSAELDVSNRNAEMTDFAVLPQYRGQKLASFLLRKMEEQMSLLNFKTLYTIARLNSPGMSKTFINSGYHYSGLLKNNTNISGQIESRTVYYKNI
ncbi:MAG: GNAT family N-acetyltransferase, partial [Prolixibacteraceae bacterium]|nr:GNAT family N-acetyltransferase [Prolixibacteraceae bacterium]